MRFLPYLLVGSMTLPVLIWVFINNFVVKGTSNNLNTQDFWVLGSLGVFVVAAFYLLSTWMDKFIQKTRG
jgi:amino acid permease